MYQTQNSNWKVSIMVAVGIFLILCVMIFGVQSSRNMAIALEEQVKSAQSGIQIQEMQRISHVQNLVDCVKQYDKHEAETFEAVVTARGSAGNIENTTTAIAAVTEAYPELKSNENYKTLMNDLVITENQIAQYRNNYNEQVKAYRRYVNKFPTYIFLSFLGYEVQNFEYLEFDAPTEAPTNLFD